MCRHYISPYCLYQPVCVFVCLCVFQTDGTHISHTRLTGSKSQLNMRSCYRRLFLSKCPWEKVGSHIWSLIMSQIKHFLDEQNFKWILGEDFYCKITWIKFHQMNFFLVLFSDWHDFCVFNIATHFITNHKSRIMRHKHRRGKKDTGHVTCVQVRAKRRFFNGGFSSWCSHWTSRERFLYLITGAYLSPIRRGLVKNGLVKNVKMVQILP